MMVVQFILSSTFRNRTHTSEATPRVDACIWRCDCCISLCCAIAENRSQHMLAACFVLETKRFCTLLAACAQLLRWAISTISLAARRRIRLCRRTSDTTYVPSRCDLNMLPTERMSDAAYVLQQHMFRCTSLMITETCASCAKQCCR